MNYMKLKTITTISLIAIIYLIFISLMIEFGAIDGINNVVEVSMDYKSISVKPIRYFLFLPYSICYMIFFTAFIWKIKRLAPKLVGIIAFVTWCFMIVFDLIDMFGNTYIVSNFSGATIMSESQLDTNYPIGKYILLLFSSFSWYTVHNIFFLFSYIPLIIMFACMIRKDKAIGIAGVIAMLLTQISVMQIPYFYILSNFGWMFLFAITLWRIQKYNGLLLQ
ncbi:hypothetical protein [Bacteroides caecigallinarum]|uniref:hypothetical protein n=1 Tax=Bacteroides caecigallinarum TaxID=1411144 RepID=UPI001F293740|nr:hypothetical protein [Bacteroides caecigallinarum]MCF2738516.1 hypothetical protein [Bacteroides caecigallinarum]